MEVLISFFEQIDENFAILYNNLEKRREDDLQTLIFAMTRFRKNISFNWLCQLQQYDATKCLTVIISTILKYTLHDDATLRVNTYSALGAMLLTVAPFSPYTFINAFGRASFDLPVTPKLSIAVINMFVYLTKFISPHKMMDFVANVPVLHHFGADVSDYIAHLNSVITMMRSLPVEFHRNILRSILSSCGRNPTFAFANCIYTLVCFNKEILITDLIGFLTDNRLEQSSIWIGPLLLADQYIYSIMGIKGRDYFLELALVELKKDKPNLTLFEYSCKIAAQVLRRERESQNFPEIQARIFGSVNRQLSAPFQAKLLYLPSSFDDIVSIKSSFDTVKGMVLTALVTYFHDNIDNVDADDIMLRFWMFKDSENDLYCTFIDSFTSIVTNCFEMCKKTTHIDIIYHLLSKKNKNWVHDEAVAQLIQRIPLYKAEKKLNGYFQLALSRLLDFSISKNIRLIKTSIECIYSFASYQNIDDILNQVLKSDWIDEGIVEKRFKLLSRLASTFQVQSFNHFIPIAFESLVFFESNSTLSNIYQFLTLIQPKEVPQYVIDFSFNYIIEQYQCYSRKKIAPFRDSYDRPIPSSYFLETIDTDIVVNPSFDHQEALVHIKNCFSFLEKTSRHSIIDYEALFWMAYYIIPLFDGFAVDAASNLVQNFDKGFNKLWEICLERFKTASKEDLISSCVKFFLKYPKQLPDFVIKGAERLLLIEGQDIDLIYTCFVFIDQMNREKSKELIKQLIPQLRPKDAIILLFHLSFVMRNFLSKISEFDEYSIVKKYALLIGDDSDLRFIDYLNDTPYLEWPLDDTVFADYVINLIDNNPIKITIHNIEYIDKIHWDFFVNNMQFFNVESILKEINDNPDMFSKFEIHRLGIILKPTKKFVMTTNSEVPRVSSIQPYLSKNVLFRNSSLITSFFSNIRTDVTHSILYEALKFAFETEDIKALRVLFIYAIRKKIPFQISSLISKPSLMLGFDIFTWFLQIYNKKITQFDTFLIEEIEKRIGEKLNPSLILRYESHYLIECLVKYDSDYFLQYIVTCEDFKAHRLLKIMPLFTIVRFNTTQLSDIIFQKLLIFNELTSNRKKIVFLRFLTLSLVSIKQQRNNTLFQTLIQAILEFFNEIQDIGSSEFIMEYSQLCYFIATNSPHVDQIIPIISLMSQNNISLSIFLPIIAQISATKGINFSNITKSTYEMLISYPLPSIQTSVLRAIYSYSMYTQSYPIYKELLPVIPKYLISLSSSFRTSQQMISLVLKLFVSLKDNEYSEQFYQDFIQIYLLNICSPNFIKALPLFPYLYSRKENIVSRLLTVLVLNFEMINAISETYSLILNDESKREQFFANHIDLLEYHYICSPSIELGQLIYKMVDSNNANTPSYLINKIPQKVNYFLCHYVITANYFLSLNSSMKESCFLILNSSEKYISPKSRYRSMELLIKTSSKNPAIIAIAASDTNDPLYEDLLI